MRRKDPGHMANATSQTSSFYSRHEPLSKRAWALQENIMSRRVLYFGSRQTFWLCSSKSTADGGLCESDGQKGSLPGSLLNDRLEWMDYVTEYAQRELTDPDDKLVAISGIARLYGESRHMEAKYLAGLWDLDLCVQLLWYSLGDTRPSKSYRAPSWSWASIDGPIEWWPHLTETPLARLESWKIELEDENLPYGSVRSGYVEIKGRLLRHTTDELDYRSTYYVGFDDTSICMPPDERVWVLEILPLTKNISTHLLLVETGEVGEFRRIGCLGVCEPKLESLKAKWDRDAKWATIKII